MKKTVCGYKSSLDFNSATTLTFDRVYDEVKLKMFDNMQIFSGSYSPNFAWYILWISHTKNKTKCS